jgi:hypothetical protein
LELLFATHVPFRCLYRSVAKQRLNRLVDWLIRVYRTEADALAAMDRLKTHPGFREYPDGSTLAGWVGGASDLLGPLVDAIQKHVLTGRKLHADDTPMPVLSPGNGARL